MDGAVLGRADASRFEVAMTDRSRWIYVATTEECDTPDGPPGIIYRCVGRA